MMRKPPHLVPEQLLASKDEALRSLIASLCPAPTVDPDDEIYGAAFRRYLLFAHLPSLAGEQLSEQEIFYNKFYWFLAFAQLYKRKQGTNDGLDQQACQILETAPCRFDWTVIEQIESLVARTPARRK